MEGLMWKLTNQEGSTYLLREDKVVAYVKAAQERGLITSVTIVAEDEVEWTPDHMIRSVAVPLQITIW